MLPEILLDEKSKQLSHPVSQLAQSDATDKVTICTDFTGTLLNFDGLFQENYKVFQDAELSQIPNPVPILSRYECNVTPHVDKVYTYRSN